MNESLEILRFLAEHPGNYDYFCNGKEQPENADESLKYATEMLAGVSKPTSTVTMITSGSRRRTSFT
jgi:hypothetical protein